MDANMSVDSLFAAVADSARRVAERHEAALALIPQLRAASRSGDPAVTERMLAAGIVDATYVAPMADSYAYFASGETAGAAGELQLARFCASRTGVAFALMDGWGSHGHPPHRNAYWDAVYVATGGRVI